MNDCRAIQLINEDKKFNQSTLEYFKQWIGDRDVGLDYHVVSVFGSQSSGKSTLLNALFKTEFDTMNAQFKRQQTTKGIWIAHSKEIACTKEVGDGVKGLDLFVLDVEGSDGAERGEDKDFERKAALFALATSEVLIVNMWEQQVGLYQGNNMGLLKTVFEVNLSLFGHKRDKQKILLLFVIRDFTGFTPLSSLLETLTAELESMWMDLNKPAEAENSTLYDFFDLDFTGLSHKLFKPEEFAGDVAKLGNRFVDRTSENFYLQAKYHQGLPLDGWTFYADSCWEQIESNKDLDLPTQQTLVAKFKTEEISNVAFNNFLSNYSTLETGLSGTELANQLKDLKDKCLAEYDNYGCRYMKNIYLEKRDELLEKLQTKFNEAISKHIDSLLESIVKNFKSLTVENASKVPFTKRLHGAREVALRTFETDTQEFVSLKLKPSLDDELAVLTVKINELAEQECAKEIKSIITRAKKYLYKNVRDTVITLLSHPKNNVWELVMVTFEKAFTESISKYKAVAEKDGDEDGILYDFQVDASLEGDQEIYQTIRSNSWTILYEVVHQYLKLDNVVSIIRDIFDNHFRYDEHDVPRLWKDELEVDEAFKIARMKAVEMLDILSTASIAGVEIVPDAELVREEQDDDDGGVDKAGADASNDIHTKRFSNILNITEKEKVLQQFRRQANFAVVEAKRSTIRTTTHIPIWMYGLLVVLGWNEFMMILRNPLLISFLLIAAAAFYFIHKLHLWGPLATFATSATEETKLTIKSKLRSMLMDGNNNSNTIPMQPIESFELQDFSNKETTEKIEQEE
ncbi:dynamin-like GTPase SEY1 Ecym_3130 [Eremothecium cymbalariae DBVPG|uniref:GB1/RHD3-type G domain-containing protein n=1 Tax=Eremothecium cymbalariae (strain CBS 270.75 / DBVPG 7215 / KCTC 17166 / NRRL Y-17582) TaxID=931890 RepID=G8JR65_ERECY|nr:Hypothetical protein Ecym_3130 [Eremothecium cymbalariae DBVPG\